MSANSAPTTESTTRSGIYSVLRYTGIPQSWIKRPKLPSRNWLIFLSTTSTIIGLYVYDRHKCKEIRDTYISRVKSFAEEPLKSWELPRKVTVYGSKWPADEDHNRSIKYFRKYVKPVLVAAAIDYDIVNGKRHGDLANKVADKIRSRRRLDLGLDEPLPNFVPSLNISQAEKNRRELSGGSIIIGRQTFKEYMEGLKCGWTDGLNIVDREEELSQELSYDGHFDEMDTPDLVNVAEGEPIPTPSRLQSLAIPAGIKTLKSPSLYPDVKATSGTYDIPPPASIPPQPPLLLVPFTNHIGLFQIPHMIYDFFNQRAKVESGASAAFRLIIGARRPIYGPSSPQEHTGASSSNSDLDFDIKAESYYKKSTLTLPTEIVKAREEYYKNLKKKLETARALARGTREPTKDEKNYPPPTEVELRAERLKKELQWRNDIKGWDIIRPDKPVAWDERFITTLSIFTDTEDVRISPEP